MQKQYIATSVVNEVNIIVFQMLLHRRNGRDL